MVDWKELALRAEDKLKDAGAFIKKVMSPPFVYGTVVNLNHDSVDVVVSGRVMEVNYVDKIKDKLKPGVGVRLNPESFAVVDTRAPSPNGVISSATEVLDDGRVVVNEHGLKYVVKVASKPSQGDRLIVDEKFNIVLQNLGKRSSQYHIAEVPVVPWSKIGGLETAIEDLKDSVEEPFVNREIYERYSKRAPKGVLLYGPPGCGKTLLAKAVAYNLSQRMQKQGKGNGNGYFLSIKGPELLNMWVGESERGIRELFSRARENSREKDDVTIVFMDEAEALLKTRGKSRSSDIYDSIVPQFLSEMDGLESNDNVVLILASNRQDIIDPAVLRPGRIDRKIRVGRPNQDAARQIFGIHFAGMPVYTEKVRESTGSLAKYASSELFSDQYPLFEVSFSQGEKDFMHMWNLASGAMIENISQEAAKRAIKREIKKGNKGLVRDDLTDSIRQEYVELNGLASFDADDLRETFPDRYESATTVNRFYGGRNGN